MKAQNSDAMIRGYILFALYLAACVGIGVSVYFFFLRTSLVELTRIVNKTEEYDAIYLRQIEITADIDSLYRYAGLFNTNLNDDQLQNAVSRRKQELLTSLNALNGRDIRLHQKLMSRINVFLGVKDSIRILKEEEEIIKNELRKCIGENKQTSRKITLGGKEIR
jgi:hypothetical protein